MCLFPDFGQPEFPEMCLFRILANSPSLARLNLQSSRCVAENNVPDNKSGIKPEFPEMCQFSDPGKQPSPAQLNLQSSRFVAENNVPDNKSGIREEKLRLDYMGA